MPGLIKILTSDKTFGDGELLWLSGKVVKMRK
jgi:hypothetical protein